MSCGGGFLCRNFGLHGTFSRSRDAAVHGKGNGGEFRRKRLKREIKIGGIPVAQRFVIRGGKADRTVCEVKFPDLDVFGEGPLRSGFKKGGKRRFAGGDGGFESRDFRVRHTHGT